MCACVRGGVRGKRASERQRKIEKQRKMEKDRESERKRERKPCVGERERARERGGKIVRGSERESGWDS